MPTMSQNVLHQQSDFEDQDLRQSFSYQLQSPFPFNPTTAESFQLRDNIQLTYSMAQPLPQYQYRPERHLQAQSRQHQRALPREQQLTAAATPTSQGRFWGSSEHAFAWNNALSMKPLIMPELDGLMSNNFAYGSIAASQNVIGKNGVEYGGSQTPWASSSTIGVPCGGLSVSSLDLGTNSSTSPKSFFSETVGSELHTFSPPVRDEASPGNWSDFDMTAYPPLKESMLKDEGIGEIDFSRLPQHGLGIPIASSTTEADRQEHTLGLSFDHSNFISSDQPSSYKSSPGATPWYPPGCSNNLSGLPYSPYASHRTLFDTQRSSFSTYGHSSVQPQYNSLHSDVIAQGRLQVPRSDSQALRKADDKILIEGKDVLGLTYKEIRKRMHINVAESTLRGRYRSLTKPKGHRVRKPVWTRNDVALLREAVLQEINRVETTHGYGLDHDSKLSKVQWKKVAEYIDSNGGTYHFGNATCKKKWVEVEAGCRDR